MIENCDSYSMTKTDLINTHSKIGVIRDQTHLEM